MGYSFPVKKKSANKYNAIRTASGFGSKLESAVYQILLLRQKSGEIKDIRQQVSVELSAAKICYKIDFSYEKLEGGLVFVEAKGVVTERWRIAEKLWRFYGPAPIEIWKGSYQKLRLVEIVVPRTLERLGTCRK